MKEIRILLDIETVLDVRYGKLIQHNPKLIPEILFKFNQYCSRDHDDFWLMFPEVDKDTFIVAETTVETLKLSKRTNVFNVIDDSLRSMSGSLTEDIKVNIILNTGKYELSDEATEAMLVLISARYEHNYKVTDVSILNKDLTPEVISGLADLVIMYDFNGWSESHISTVQEVDLSMVTFYIPTLFRDKKEAERGFYESIKNLPIEGEPLEVLSDFIWETYRLNIYFISNKFFSPISLA
ncbi:hypothetical protein TSMG0068 [Halocynthia phage JM-2012]|uniref:hypothetical protein n=1 Tax=Halocynthia phage JM-2012 TaxID=1173297 RepID=UPI00025C6918|nr:hypothetical protein TSMG0068 [Halocynthia phage JM-2012]AFI55351.1 hypothetical protein TSMG0068 [Halocynthia phage JM-2012]